MVARGRQAMVDIFRKDLSYLLSLAGEADRFFSSLDNKRGHSLKRLRAAVDRMNEKYPGIHAIVRKTTHNIFLGFLIRKASVNEVFDEFKKELLGSSKNKTISLEFSKEKKEEERGVSPETIALKRNPHRDMVELIYREATLENADSPEFRLLSSHALLGWDPGITVGLPEE